MVPTAFSCWWPVRSDAEFARLLWQGDRDCPNKKDMDALLKRAEECELAATRSNDQADQAANLWFATKYREKAAALAQASRPGRLGAV